MSQLVDTGLAVAPVQRRVSTVSVRRLLMPPRRSLSASSSTHTRSWSCSVSLRLRHPSFPSQVSYSMRRSCSSVSSLFGYLSASAAIVTYYHFPIQFSITSIFSLKGNCVALYALFLFYFIILLSHLSSHTWSFCCCCCSLEMPSIDPGGV